VRTALRRQASEGEIGIFVLFYFCFTFGLHLDEGSGTVSASHHTLFFGFAFLYNFDRTSAPGS